MSFLDDLKARSKRGPGAVEVYFSDDEKPLLVPLRYPTAQSQAEFVSAVDNLDDQATGAASFEQNEGLVKLAVKFCVKDSDQITDDDLTVLIRESGGPMGVLAQRCQQLLGLGSGPGKRSKVVAGNRKRGR